MEHLVPYAQFAFRKESELAVSQYMPTSDGETADAVFAAAFLPRPRTSLDRCVEKGDQIMLQAQEALW
jgi:hypothetical protein